MKAHKMCDFCGRRTRDWFVVETAWQQGDTDTWSMSATELIADGAKVACGYCVNTNADVYEEEEAS